MTPETLSAKRRRAALSRTRLGGGNANSGSVKPGDPGRPGAGRPRKAERCACGEMTAMRAKARGHKCP